jgi:hypothetical protein
LMRSRSCASASARASIGAPYTPSP